MTYARLLAFAAVVLTGLYLPVPAAGQAATPPQLDRLDWAAYFWVDMRSLTDEEEEDGLDPVHLERARVALLGDVTRRVHWFVSAELTRRAFLRSAHVGVHVSPYLTLRAGQVFVPMTFERSNLPALEITQTPLSRQLAYGSNPGITVFNRRPFKGGISYNVSLITGTGSNRWDDNSAKDLVGRLIIAPRALQGLSFLVNGATGEQPTGTRTRSGLGLQYNHRLFKLSAEGLRERFDGRQDRSGFYVLGVYRIRPERPRALFQMAELVARYLTFEDSTTIREWQMGGNYHINRNVRLTVNLVLPVDDRPRPETTLIARTQLLF